MIAVSDRLTTGWKLAGTDTMRRACGKLLSYYGSNVQNPSPSLMRCIVPPDGYRFLQRDQSGAEALIVAMEAPRGKFRELFDVGIKVHSYMALQLFTEKFVGAENVGTYRMISPRTLAALPEAKKLLGTIKNSQREYDLGKRVIHAKNYAMGPKTFQLNCLELSEGAVNLSYSEAKAFLTAHESIFPEIIQWQAEIRGRAAATATRTLYNLFGYPKEFRGIWNNALERKLYAFVPQSTVGIITALAIIDMWHYIKLRRLPWFVLNDKHDSFLLAVPDQAEHIEHARIKSGEFIGRELRSSRGEHFKMKSGLALGYNWAKHDKETNPNGMKEED